MAEHQPVKARADGGVPAETDGELCGNPQGHVGGDANRETGDDEDFEEEANRETGDDEDLREEGADDADPEELDGESRGQPRRRVGNGAKAGAVVLVNVKGEDEDEAAMQQPSTTRRRKTGVKAKEDKRSRGLLLASEANIDFSQTFQAAHRAKKAPCKKGHWDQFLCCLSTEKVMKCVVCAELRSQIRDPVPSQGGQGEQGALVLADPVDPDETPIADLGICKRKRGRPPSKSKNGDVPEVPQLKDHVERHRRGVYRHLQGARYFCEPCGGEVFFQRESTSGWSFVLIHERSQKHQRGLHTRGLSGGLIAQAVVPVQLTGECSGHKLGSPECLLAGLEASLRAWLAAGTPLIKGSPLEKVVVHYEGDHAVLRHKDCLGAKAGSSLCVGCQQLARVRPYMKDFATWGYKLDLADLVFRAAYRPSSIPGFLEDMGKRDYTKYLKAEVARCAEVFQQHGLAGVHDLCTRAFYCINTRARGPSLQAFIKANIDGLVLHDQEDEQLAYQTLVESLGEADSSDLKLASWVASGGLKKHQAVECLFKTFCYAERRSAAGKDKRPGSSMFVNEETKLELLYTLGSGTAAQDMLRMFHVPAKAATCTVDFQSELLPRFFLSHLEPDDQVQSAKVIAKLLGQGSNATQPVRVLTMSMDETIWRKAFEAIPNLGGEGFWIVGGGWSPDQNCALLRRADARQDAWLSRMTMSFVVTRTDDNGPIFDLDMVPLFQAKAKTAEVSKGQLFMQLAGQALESMTKATGLPPVCPAADNGLANGMVHRAFLGLLSPGDMDQPFFRDCQQTRLDSIPHFPFSSLSWRRHGVHGSNDVFRCLKNYTLQVMGSTRTILQGSFYADFDVMFRAGLPITAFTARDPQSDRDSWFRLNARFLEISTEPAWMSDGLLITCFLGALVASVWLCDLPPHLTLQSALTAYYLLMMHVSENKRRCGSRWSESTLPLVTVRNLLHLLAHAVIACVSHDGVSPWSLRGRTERPSESWFGRVKSAWTGQPSIRDSVYGTYYQHLQSWKTSRNARWSKPEPEKPVPLDDAVEMGVRALQDAACFQSVISRHRSADLIVNDFKHWWATEGKSFLAVHSASAEASETVNAWDVPEEGEYIEELEDTAEPDEEKQAGDLLECCDSHVQLKKNIEALMTELTQENVATPAPAEPALLAPLPESVNQPPADFSGISVCELLNKVRQLPALGLPQNDQSAIGNLQQRMEQLRPLLHDFVRNVHLATGELSRAQIFRELKQYPEDGWHQLCHELALARQASCFVDTGGRCSRHAAWTQRQEKIEAIAADVTCGTSSLRPVRLFGTKEQRQIFLFEVNGNVCLGLLLTTYRGALLKGKGGGRRLAVQRPCASPVPVTMCGKLRVVELVEATPTCWFASALNRVDTVEPTAVLAEFVPNSVVTHPSRTSFHFSLEATAQLNDFVKSKVWKQDAEAAPAMPSSSTLKGIQGLNNRSFPPASCGKLVPDFLRKLPDMYMKSSTPLLDGERFHLKSRSKSVLWEEMCVRAVTLFDVILAGKSTQEYSASVFTVLSELHPSRNGALKAVESFVQKVDSIAPPWLPVT